MNTSIKYTLSAVVALVIVASGFMYFGAPTKNSTEDPNQNGGNHALAAQEPVKANEDTAIKMPAGSQPQTSANADTKGSDNVTDSEKTKLLQIAAAECDRMGAPVQERPFTLTATEGLATVVYSPSPGTRAGDFVVKIDRATGKILDTKIWR